MLSLYAAHWARRHNLEPLGGTQMRWNWQSIPELADLPSAEAQRIWRQCSAGSMLRLIVVCAFVMTLSMFLLSLLGQEILLRTGLAGAFSAVVAVQDRMRRTRAKIRAHLDSESAENASA